MRLPLLVCALFGFSSAIDCPHGYTDDGSGTCFSPVIVEAERTTAYKICADSNAYMYIITNAFVNNKVQSFGSKYDKLWLGLTCLENNIASCQWDNGRALGSEGYNNFFEGSPNATAGACVYMQISNGRWISAPCSYTYLWMGCQYTPGTIVANCADATASYFRGKCYYGKNALDYDSARTQCNSTCGNMASIHSTGMNSFLRDFSTVDQVTDYTILGITSNQSSYIWDDRSVVNYRNFGYEDQGLGPCVSMALKSQLVSRGQWINSPCNAISSKYVMCEKDPINDCDHTVVTTPTTPSPTLAPIQCSGSTTRLNGSGTLYSPGYPRSSQPNHCDYFISESAGLIAFITFEELILDGNSSILLFNNLFEKDPFVRITHSSNMSYYSTGNMLRVVFDTNSVSTAGDNTTNYFKAQYGGLPPLQCTGTQMLGSGGFTSPNYPSAYPNSYDQTWCLTSNSGSGIQLVFADFLTERNFDYVNVFDLRGNITMLTGGPFTNLSVTTFTRHMKVVFHTDQSNVDRGFNATFSSIIVD